MQIEVVRGDAAHVLLGQQAFREDWQRLSDGCPWATSFQGPGFAATWYECYRTRYSPLLLLSRDHDGKLTGLLPLAVAAGSGALIVAGGPQAEYQAWICGSDLSEGFATEAIRAVHREVPGAEWTFRYLPPGMALDWVAKPEARRICKLRSFRKPLVRLGQTIPAAKSLKSRGRFSRLKKLGELEFKRISSVDELRPLLDMFIEFCDLRHAAVHGTAPFLKDDLKRRFHVAMAEVPGLLHMTLFKAGTNIMAIHLGTTSKTELHLGIVAYNPFLPKHLSVGNFHILFLCDLLREEGFTTLDLTPGGDSYKESFSNDHDQVGVLTVFGSALGRGWDGLQRRLAGAAKKTLGLVHVTPAQCRAAVAMLRRVHPIRTPATLARKTREWVYRCREMRVYYYDTAGVRELGAPPEGIRRDAVDDLLSYQPAEAWQSRRQFLSSALERFADGLHSYSHAENGRLLHYGWLIERQERSFVWEVGQEFVLPPNSSYLFDFYTFPSARGRGLDTISLRAMLCDAAKIPGTERIYISVPADNGPLRHAIEEVGFTYETSLFEDICFGRARRWRSPA